MGQPRDPRPSVQIIAYAHPDPLVGLRGASWRGPVNWPGAPTPGSTWFCCYDDTDAVVARVSFIGPSVPNRQTHLDVEVKTTAEHLSHLVDVHGFDPIRAEATS